MNQIRQLRTELKLHFNEKLYTKGETTLSTSPSGKFMLAATVFYSKATNWELVQMEIYKQESNKKTIDFLINDSQFFMLGW